MKGIHPHLDLDTWIIPDQILADPGDEVPD